MTIWTSDELDKIGTAAELEIAALRPDGTLRNPVTIWVVRHRDDLYVRSGYGNRAAWYRGTQRRRQEADLDHVLLNDVADRGEQGGDVFALHPRPAARVEHRLHLLDDKGHVAAAAEHRADHPGQRDGPGVVLHVLRVDEDIERPPPAVLDDRSEGTRLN